MRAFANKAIWTSTHTHMRAYIALLLARQQLRAYKMQKHQDSAMRNTFYAYTHTFKGYMCVHRAMRLHCCKQSSSESNEMKK